MLKATAREIGAARKVAEAVMEFLVIWEEGRRSRTPEPPTPKVEVKLPEMPAAPAPQTDPPKQLPPSAAHPDRLLGVDKVAELLECSPRTVYRLADSGWMPRPRKVGRLVRWPIAEIRKWIENGCPKQYRRR